MECPKCGGEIMSIQNVCQHCGEDLSSKDGLKEEPILKQVEELNTLRWKCLTSIIAMILIIFFGILIRTEITATICGFGLIIFYIRLLSKVDRILMKINYSIIRRLIVFGLLLLPPLEDIAIIIMSHKRYLYKNIYISFITGIVFITFIATMVYIDIKVREFKKNLRKEK